MCAFRGALTVYVGAELLLDTQEKREGSPYAEFHLLDP